MAVVGVRTAGNVSDFFENQSVHILKYYPVIKSSHGSVYFTVSPEIRTG